MGAFLIITLVVSGLIFIGIISYSLSIRIRKSEFKNWKVGDIIYTHTSDTGFKLVGWSVDAYYLKIEGVVHKKEWTTYKFNKSEIWRRNYENCKTDMGVEPGFSPNLGKTKEVKQINGKPIELFTEIECQVYLKQCLDSEDYDTAELIRKRMESFR